MNPDGSELEVHAWGLRNPFGLRFAPDGRLFCSEDSYDERGSRPIANAPVCLWVIEKGAFHGFPDFAAGIPVTDARFRSSRGEPPTFLMKKHPPVAKPFLTLPPHATPTKFDFAPEAFGRAMAGRMLLCEFGAGNPVAGPGGARAGFQVVSIDREKATVEPFLRARDEALGPRGAEHVATAGPRRPIAARFSPGGRSLYVADLGPIQAYVAGAGPIVRPFPGTGVIWRVTQDGVEPEGPPAGLSPQPRRAGRGARKD